MKQCWLRDQCSGIDCDKDFCIRKYKIEKLFELALLSDVDKTDVKLRIDADKRDLDAFTWLRSVMQAIDKFVESGDSIYIHSIITGNGKTQWAKKLIKAYLMKIWAKSDLRCRALFIHVPKFLLALKDNINNPSEYVAYIKDNVYDADLVVFDEVGTKSLTSFEHEHILSIINARLDLGKSNIYTSNLTDDELLNKMGDRLYSRVVNNSQNVVFVGQDKRGLY